MFLINGIEWKIKFVHSASGKLMRSSLAVTDWNDRAIYVSDKPKNGYLRKILAHELCHCFCFSYNIHMPIEQEEYLADWISLYGTDLIYLLDDLMANIDWIDELNKSDYAAKALLFTSENFRKNFRSPLP